MKPQLSVPEAPRRRGLPKLIRWLAWGLLLVLGGGLVLQIVTTVFSVARTGWDARALAPLLFIAIFVVGFFGIKALTNPILGRDDERLAGREKFPNHTEQEIERFLRVAGDSLLTSEKHHHRLRPDDTPASITQEWLGGDGMDIIELIMALEEQYGLTLPEDSPERLRTLGDLFALVTQHGSGRTDFAAAPRAAPPETGSDTTADGGVGEAGAVQKGRNLNGRDVVGNSDAGHYGVSTEGVRTDARHRQILDGHRDDHVSAWAGVARGGDLAAVGGLGEI